MKCPNCKNKTLKNVIIYNTPVDYCPKCHGIWLENGELDKIVEDVDEIGKEV